MAELSSSPAEKARKAFSAVLQSMQEPGTARNVAQILGVSDATVSRTKTEKLEDAITLLYHLGFKVVSSDMTCYPAEYMQALHTLARIQVVEGPKLDWDS